MDYVHSRLIEFDRQDKVLQGKIDMAHDSLDSTEAELAEFKKKHY